MFVAISEIEGNELGKAGEQRWVSTQPTTLLMFSQWNSLARASGLYSAPGDQHRADKDTREQREHAGNGGRCVVSLGDLLRW